MVFGLSVIICLAVLAVVGLAWLFPSQRKTDKDE